MSNIITVRNGVVARVRIYLFIRIFFFLSLYLARPATHELSLVIPILCIIIVQRRASL